MKKIFLSIFLCTGFYTLLAQAKIQVNESAKLTQVYGDSETSDELLPMNDLDMEFGYVLYSTDININENSSVILMMENVRDYASVFIDNELKGTLTLNSNSLNIDLKEGKHKLQLYVENIGRITYGPEILDNFKGLFGEATLNDESLENWEITPLKVRESDLSKLNFEQRDSKNTLPAYFKGNFILKNIDHPYINMEGWGMGEVWINNKYIGTYWENESQKTLSIPSETLIKGENSIIIFDLKPTNKQTVEFNDKPIFN